MFMPATEVDFRDALKAPCDFAKSELNNISAAEAFSVFESSIGKVACRNADGDLLCLWGIRVINLMCGSGLVWFIATSTHKGRIDALKSFPGLAHFVPSTILTLCASIENKTNARWASWCGMREVTPNYYEWSR